MKTSVGITLFEELDKYTTEIILYEKPAKPLEHQNFKTKKMQFKI